MGFSGHTALCVTRNLCRNLIINVYFNIVWVHVGHAELRQLEPLTCAGTPRSLRSCDNRKVPSNGSRTIAGLIKCRGPAKQKCILIQTERLHILTPLT